jgi:hypothetical protein
MERAGGSEKETFSEEVWSWDGESGFEKWQQGKL